MTPEEFDLEVQRLARTCVVLSRTPGGLGLAGYWGGTPMVECDPDKADRDSLYRPATNQPLDTAECEHWLTVDLKFVPTSRDPYRGILSLFEDMEECRTFICRDQASKLEIPDGGIPLYAHEGRSFPPDFAVTKYGSKSMMDWLEKIDWKPGHGFNTSYFPEGDVVQPYFDKYWPMTNSPFTFVSAEVEFDAHMGGWGASPECDGDPYPSDEGLDLVLYTYRDSEPWMEVNSDGVHFKADFRST